jgi:hypothetical protein
MANFQGKGVATFGVGIPVYQTVESTQLAFDYQIAASIMAGF